MKKLILLKIIFSIVALSACSSKSVKTYATYDPKLKEGKYLNYYWFDEKYNKSLNNPVIKLKQVTIENYKDIDAEDIEDYKIWFAERIQEKSQSIVMKKIYGDKFDDNDPKNNRELLLDHLKNAKRFPLNSKEYLTYRYGNFVARELLWKNIPSIEYDAELEIKISEISHGNEAKRKFWGPLAKSNKAFIHVKGQLIYHNDIIAMLDHYEESNCYEEFSLTDNLLYEANTQGCINYLLIKTSNNLINEISETLFSNK